ncbi:MAG: chloride channel protein [Gammaproteobacteria bacterium]|jgi:CIC family chloride channel protein|nr:chloride channel protein [Gammaproteobacteria bacterium]
MKPAPQTLHHIIAISLAGMIVGLVAAFATAGFVELVQYLNDRLFISALSRENLPAGELAMITIAVLTIGGLIVGLLLHYTVSSKAPLGPADTIFALQLHERLPAPGSGLSSTLASILSLGCGASVGQYGPLVYLGTLVGQISNRLPFGLPYLRSITIACGVAAAISTAFNAPIAALIFTHEVILRHYSLRMFTAVTVASACGYFVANVVFDHPPLFLFDIDGSFRAIEFLLFAIEGVACGVLAVLLMKSLKYCARLSARVKIPAPLKPMLAGFVTALIALQVPEVLGAGQDVFREAILGNSYSADSLLLILSAKMLVTVICIGFGFAGGVIFPSMLIGVLFGALFALLVPELLLDSYSGVSDYAICGMVAIMSPVIGAPMTALLLVFEMTRNYEITIAAMVAVVFANLIASIWYGRSLYDQQLAGRGIDLSLGRERAYLMHHKVGEHLRDCLPVLSQRASLAEASAQMSTRQTASLVIVDEQQCYLGVLLQPQLVGLDAGNSIATIELQTLPHFTEQTSIWDAMQVMRSYLGEAIAVVDAANGRYLGAMPESAVINAYLDATEELRREEHEI